MVDPYSYKRLCLNPKNRSKLCNVATWQTHVHNLCNFLIHYGTALLEYVIKVICTYIHTLIYCNRAVRGLTDIIICMTPEGMQHPREGADISVKLRTCPCYNIYVTLSIAVYSIAHNYPGITALQVKYYAVQL